MRSCRLTPGRAQAAMRAAAREPALERAPALEWVLEPEPEPARVSLAPVRLDYLRKTRCPRV